MGKLHRKVMKILRQHLGPVTDALEQVQSTGRVTGAVISPGFNGLDFDERQVRLWNVLRENLTTDEEAHVGPIVALTPAEAEIKAI